MIPIHRLSHRLSMTDTQLGTQLQGELAPDFQIVRLLGEGSMANVYLAREQELQRMVAIKVMKAELAGDETARKRFEREARSAAKIHHHNVTAVYRVGSLEDETPFIVMEHIEGRNLSDALQAEGAMDIEQACNVLGQLASALAAAHENGIVHRDVRPANVVRERDSDRVVLTDFGIAGILDTGADSVTRLTQQGQLLGDPRYMSPEQLLGDPLTDESDVYSLGILGYEILTLKHAYGARRRCRLRRPISRRSRFRCWSCVPTPTPAWRSCLLAVWRRSPCTGPERRRWPRPWSTSRRSLVRSS